MKSHLISRVLLKRFTYNKKVNLTYKKTNKTYQKEVGGVGYINFPAEFIKEVEKRWGDIETKCNIAFKSLDDRVFDIDEENIKTIKELIVLHFVRSYSTLELLKRQESIYRNRLIDELRLEPSFKINEERNIKYIEYKWKKDLPKLIIDLIETSSKKIETFIDNHYLEIGVSENGNNFILSDIPVVNISENGKLGVLNGIGITSSVGLFLPLGPNQIVALNSNKPLKQYKLLNEQEVSSINDKSYRNSLVGYFSKP